MTMFVLPRTAGRPPGSASPPRGNSGAPLSVTGPSACVREMFRRHKPAAGLDVVVVPRREFLDAAFASLEVDYPRCLGRRARRRPRPRRAAAGVAARAVLARFAGYKFCCRRCSRASCRFAPSCSAYMARGHRRGTAPGGAGWRCGGSRRCHPFGGRLRSRSAETSMITMEHRVLLAVVLLLRWCSSATRRCFRRRSRQQGTASTGQSGRASTLPAADRHRRPRHRRRAAGADRARCRGRARRRDRRARDRRRDDDACTAMFSNRGGRARGAGSSRTTETGPARRSRARESAARTTPRRSRCRRRCRASATAEQRALPGRPATRSRRADARSTHRRRSSFECRRRIEAAARKKFRFQPQSLHRHVRRRRASGAARQP